MIPGTMNVMAALSHKAPLTLRTGPYGGAPDLISQTFTCREQRSEGDRDLRQEKDSAQVRLPAAGFGEEGGHAARNVGGP